MMANFKTRTCKGILGIVLGRAYSQKNEGTAILFYK
jgi:hypothetical protein